LNDNYKPKKQHEKAENDYLVTPKQKDIVDKIRNQAKTQLKRDSKMDVTSNLASFKHPPRKGKLAHDADPFTSVEKQKTKVIRQST
jgi:hypothetical protein